ncbi:MAG: exodeoxyribonuclease VII small subunit [Acetanaerobacterium sp.]
MAKKDEPVSVEQSLKELEDIVKQLEGGETDLKTSLKLYEQGTILIAKCQKSLKEAELRITELSSAESKLDEQ